jgi:hypothetical protein
MTERMEVKEGERGRVRVFAVDLAPSELAAFRDPDGDWPLKAALGADTLDPAHVEAFPVSDLEGLGLSGYLSEGHGIPDDQLADMRARLDAQTGPVMVLTSRAFHGTAQTLTPRAPLRLLASFTEERPPVSFAPLPSGDAGRTAPSDDSTAAPPRKSAAAQSGRVAMIALLVLFALAAVVIWVAA